MKLICTQENLSRGLAIVSRGIGKSPSLPVLANILLTTEKGRLKLQTTDLEIGITYFSGGKIEKEGGITIPAQLFLGYIDNLPSAKVKLEVKDKTLHISCENFEADIKGIDAEEFPLIPKIEKKSICTVAASDLKEALSKVSFATALEEARPEIAGVYMNISQNLRLAATDSFRLAEKTIKLKQPVKGSVEVIVPSRTIQELIRIISEEAKDVDVLVSENQIAFRLDDSELVSRLVDGKYPDYKQIIPKEYTCQAILDTGDLQSSIRTASLFSKTGVFDIKIDIRPKEDEVIITSESGQVGSNVAKIKGKVEGKAEKVTFNYRYLLDGLDHMTASQVLLGVTGDATPACLKPQDEKDYTYVVMPIKQ